MKTCIAKQQQHAKSNDLDFDFEHVDGSEVPGTMSRNSLVRENCPEREHCRPDVWFTTGKHPSYKN